MSRARSALAVLVALALAAPSRAETLKVPADFETIQAAVDAALAGDVVSVSKGVYAERVIVTTSGIALRGKGATIDAQYQGNCVSVTADDVEVSGFTLVNGSASEGTEAGGLVHDGSGALISKLDVRACASLGIALFGTGVIDKCTVDGIVGSGILVETGDVLGDVVTEVSRNTVTRCFDGISLLDGPFLVEKNVSGHNGDVGLAVTIPLVFSIGPQGLVASVVSKNECRDNGGTGLGLSDLSGTGMRVEKNVSEDNQVGAFVNGFALVLLSNTLDDNQVGGLYLQAIGCEVEQNKVRGNGFVGILVTTASAADGGGNDGNNLLRGNAIEDNGGDGVRVMSDDNTIDDNVVKGNLGDGIMIFDATLASTAVSGNTVKDNGHDGIDNGGTDSFLFGNVCKGNGGADLAGAGAGGGSVIEQSGQNVTGDGTGLESLQELELDTISF